MMTAGAMLDQEMNDGGGSVEVFEVIGLIGGLAIVWLGAGVVISH